MSYWLPASGTVYYPPSRPIARVLSTTEFVKPTNVFFHAQTERLLLVGHPYYDVHETPGESKITVPKVSGNQYRVLRLKLPDPNRFALVDKGLYDPDHERLVWRLQGIQIGREGPLGIGATGNPLFNKYIDTENPGSSPPAIDETKDYRVDMSMDPKQVQLFIVGCQPPVGLHWDVVECSDKQNGDCPPLQMVHSIIQDGQMCDIGYGACNFATLQEDRSSVPLEIANETCKWPDFSKMANDIYGNQMFFYGSREQMYGRHFYAGAGVAGDPIPEERDFYRTIDKVNNQDKALGPHGYQVTPSGSLLSTDSQMFNKPFWLQKAQGNNDGIVWNNDLFVTVVDNTHNTNMLLTVYKADADTLNNQYTYKNSDFKYYLRHAEGYEVNLILQLMRVPLKADILAHLQVMDPNILKGWQLGFVPPPPQGLEDEYRYVRSLATFCTADGNTPKETEDEDPYKNYYFWEIDMSDTFSTDLSQFQLGRRFIYQFNIVNGGSSLQSTSRSASRTSKRVRYVDTVERKPVKRRRSRK